MCIYVSICRCICVLFFRYLRVAVSMTLCVHVFMQRCVLLYVTVRSQWDDADGSVCWLIGIAKLMQWRIIQLVADRVIFTISVHSRLLPSFSVHVNVGCMHQHYVCTHVFVCPDLSRLKLLLDAVTSDVVCLCVRACARACVRCMHGIHVWMWACVHVCQVGVDACHEMINDLPVRTAISCPTL